MNETVILILLSGAAAALVFSIYLLLTQSTNHTGTPDPVEYAQPDFTMPAGFRVVSLPSDSIIQLKSSHLIGGAVGELTFLIEPGWPAYLRVAPIGTDLGLDDWQAQYDSRQTLDFAGTSALLRQNPGREALLTWSRDGFGYALYYPETEITLAGGLADDFVTETKSETSPT